MKSILWFKQLQSCHFLSVFINMQVFVCAFHNLYEILKIIGRKRLKDERGVGGTRGEAEDAKAECE